MDSLKQSLRQNCRCSAGHAVKNMAGRSKSFCRGQTPGAHALGALGLLSNAVFFGVFAPGVREPCCACAFTATVATWFIMRHRQRSSIEKFEENCIPSKPLEQRPLLATSNGWPYHRCAYQHRSIRDPSRSAVDDTLLFVSRPPILL